MGMKMENIFDNVYRKYTQSPVLLNNSGHVGRPPRNGDSYIACGSRIPPLYGCRGREWGKRVGMRGRASVCV